MNSVIFFLSLCPHTHTVSLPSHSCPLPLKPFSFQQVPPPFSVFSFSMWPLSLIRVSCQSVGGNLKTEYSHLDKKYSSF